jgi:membrane protease YdiL (CAAX protease family)
MSDETVVDEADSAAPSEPPAPFPVGADTTPAAAATVLSRRPFGPLVSIVLTVLVVVVLLLTQVAVFIATEMVTGTKGQEAAKSASGLSSALSVSLAAIVSNAVALGLAALLVALRRQPVRDYLGLALATRKQAWVSVGGMLILMGATEFTTYSLGRPLAPPWMVNIYRTGWHFLLFLAIAVGAPAGEEVLFRGFLYRGIAASRWGSLVAILVTSLFWAGLHLTEYDLYGVGAIAVMGLYLGAVRLNTGSVLLTMLLHGLNNSLGFAEVAYFARHPG